MKIFMRNIGMTLHVIHKLRAEGIDNVQVNMDWQHLLMNGEHLPEYAALLAAEGLLGHQHANSGWGIFDDDNMVGATAFMETVELALELRRADYGANGERLGFDLYPYTEDQVGGRQALGASSGTSSTRSPQRIDGDAAARGAAAQGRRRGLRARLRRAGRARIARMTRLRRDSTSAPRRSRASRSTSDGAVLAVAERGYPLSTPRPGWSEQDPEDWWRGAAEVLEELDAASAAGIGLSGQMHGLVALDAGGRPLRPAILWNDGRTQAQCEEIEERIGFERLVRADRQPRAGRASPRPSCCGWPSTSPRSTGASRTSCCPRTTSASSSPTSTPSTSPTPRARCSSTSPRAAGATRWSDALDVDPAWLPTVYESPAVTGVTHGGVPVAAGAGDQAAGALGVGVVAEGGPASVVLGTSGVVFAALDRYAHDPEARVHAFCHAVPQAWHVMGVMLSAAGSLQWLRETVGRAPTTSCSAARPSWEPGVEGLLFAPYLAGERTPHADRRARRLRRARPAPRPRRPGARGARGRGLRPARRARPRRGARRAPARRAHLRRRRALAAVAGDRRLGARDAARGDGGRRGRRVRRGAAGRRGRRACGTTRARRCRRA